MRVFILLLLLSFGFSNLQAQQDGAPYSYTENINAHISKSIVAAGETFPFSLEITMNGKPTYSQMAYADLIDRDGKKVSGTIIPLHKGKASAYLKVHSDVPSDNYLFRIYTRIGSSMGDEEHYYHSLITVINPIARPADTSQKISPTWRYQALENSIQLSLDKENLRSGEKGKLIISAQPNQQLTVSISKKNPYLTNLKPPTILPKSEKPNQQLIPELRGHIVQGAVSENELDTTKVYYLSAHGSKSALFVGRPDRHGKVHFELGALQDYDFLLLQTAQDSVPFSMSVQQPFAPSPSEELLKFPALELSEIDEGLLNDLVLSYSTTDYYLKPEIRKPRPIVTGYTADRAYNLDDYNRFKDLATTLKEYVPTVLVRKKAGKYHFKLSNLPENKLFKSNPLMLIDAMPVFDSDDLGRLKADSIKRIEVINRNFYILDNRFEGMINFKSFHNDFGGFPIPERALFLEYPKIQQPLIWEFNSAPAEENSRLPDFRTILFWGENLQTGKDGQAEIDFTTSQIPGDYEVSVSTISADGKQTRSTLDFNVLKE